MSREEDYAIVVINAKRNLAEHLLKKNYEYLDDPSPFGRIDATSLIGGDAERYVSYREQRRYRRHREGKDIQPALKNLKISEERVKVKIPEPFSFRRLMEEENERKRSERKREKRVFRSIFTMD